MARPLLAGCFMSQEFQMITATINQERCANCGLCIDLCPEHAISMNDTVTVDSSICTGCGSCIDECPNEAIALSRAARCATR